MKKNDWKMRLFGPGMPGIQAQNKKKRRTAEEIDLELAKLDKQELIHRISESLLNMDKTFIAGQHRRQMTSIKKYAKRGGVVSMKNGSHTFELVSGDGYMCKKCGATGKYTHHPLDPREEYVFTDGPANCPGNGIIDIAAQPTGRVVLKVHLDSFNLKSGTILDILPCPAQYIDRFADKIWVKNGKPAEEDVRLLDGEYIRIPEDFTEAEVKELETFYKYNPARR